jgi:hypothetical protein
MPDVHAVGVHHPRHDLVVGVHVRSGHILLGPDGVDDLGDVAPGERFEFAPGHARGIADDAALAAAERNVGNGALPCHPGSERRHFIETDPGMVPDATLRRPERDVVLNAVPGEDLDFTVVHLHRTRHGDLALGVRQDLPDARLQVENAGRTVELLQHRTEDRTVGRHDDPNIMKIDESDRRDGEGAMAA